MLEVKSALENLFTKALLYDDIDRDFCTQVYKISSFSDDLEKNKIKLFTQAFIFSVHLSKWDLLSTLIVNPLCTKIPLGNIRAALWQAGFEKRLDVVALIKTHHASVLYVRDERFIFFAKNYLLEKMDYHSWSK